MDPLKSAFLSPGDEFSPIPFWFWNDALSDEKLTAQLHSFYEKGIRGVIIHPRKGLPNEDRYLSEAFLSHVEAVVREATQLGMYIFLYDEAMYPSGSANGQVVKTNPSFASKGLMQCTYDENYPPVFEDGFWFVSAAVQEKRKDGSVLNSGFDSLEEALHFARALANPCSVYYYVLVYSGGTIRGVHEGEDDGEPNAPKASDLLDPDAVDLFIHLTYDVYYDRLKEWFGTTIISVFTDEPSILGRFPKKGLIPWTHGFLNDFLSAGGKRADFPLLFIPSEENSEAQQHYRFAVNKRMRRCYFKPISDWCLSHDIMLSGHPQSSEDIGFLEYFQLPCQDMVWRYLDPDLKNGLEGPHSTMGKCSADSARHRRKRRNGNECFGACGRKDDPWNLTSDDLKWYLDWLFVRGVNLIIPHAFYYSLRDDRVNERPPDVGPNSIWWDYYEKIVNYIKRMSWLMTDSRNTTGIAVLCTEDRLPWASVQKLYQNQTEFNYLEADLLKDCSCGPDGLSIADQTYQVILKEEALFLTQKHRTFLKEFSKKGIRILSLSKANPLLIKQEYDPYALKTDRYVPDLRVSHVIKNSTHFYTMVNEGDTDLRFFAEIPPEGKRELWLPWEGCFLPLPDSGPVPVNLNYRESAVIAVMPGKKLMLEMRQMVILSEKKVLYQADFSLSEDFRPTSVSVSHNGEIAELLLDDKPLVTIMWKPYVFTFDTPPEPGKHTVTAIITAGMSKRIIPDAPVLSLY